MRNQCLLSLALAVLALPLAAHADTYTYTFTVSGATFAQYDGTSTWTESALLTSETTVPLSAITTTVSTLTDIVIDPTSGACPSFSLTAASCVQEDLTGGQWSYFHFASALTLPGTYTTGVGTLTIVDDSTATPEPSSLVLLGTGLFGLAAMGRKRLFTF